MISQIKLLNGKIDSPLSFYQPSNEVIELTLEAHKDKTHGDMILTRSFREFNDYSLIERASLDQKDWLGWSPEPSSNPDEAWMFTGTSNATRNNILSMAAHVGQRIMFPRAAAQNEMQQEDKDAAYVMTGMLEYNFRENDFQNTFLYAIISGLVNPVTYYKANYCQAYMSVLEGTNSDYTRKKVIDDAMSGFQHYLLPCDEVLISNPYCFDLHRQKVLIHRRRVSYSEAKGYYENHENWPHVKIGMIPEYNASDAMFYDVQDPIQDNMVEICTYKYRSIDVEFDEVNRIYMGNPNTDYNPFKHRTNKNKPAYDIAKFGAEPIDAKRFWAYKSIAAKLSNDKELVDRLRQNAVDASTLATYPSIITMGAGTVNAGVIKPATVTDIDKDAKIQALPIANPAPAWAAMREAQQDIDAAANPSYFSIPQGSKTTTLQMQILQQNAIANLTVITTMIASMLKDIGTIVLHDSLRFQTLAQIGEITNGIPQLLYKSYNVPKVKNGKSSTDRIVFTDAYAGLEMTKHEKELAGIALIEKHGDGETVYEANPEILMNLDYLVIITPDELRPDDAASIRKDKLEIYDKAIANPIIMNDPEKMSEITRDFLFEPVVHGEASRYIPDQSTQKVLNQVMPEAAAGAKGGQLSPQNAASQNQPVGVK